MDPRAQQILLLGRKLTALFAAELEALRARRPGELSANADERAKLALLFQREAAALKADAAALKALPASQRAELAKTVGDFQATLKAHAAALDRVRRVSEGLIKAVAEEVAANRLPPAGYGGAAGRPRAKPAAASIAVNAVA